MNKKSNLGNLKDFYNQSMFSVEEEDNNKDDVEEKIKFSTIKKKRNEESTTEEFMSCKFNCIDSINGYIKFKNSYILENADEKLQIDENKNSNSNIKKEDKEIYNYKVEVIDNINNIKPDYELITNNAKQEVEEEYELNFERLSLIKDKSKLKKIFDFFEKDNI